MSKKKIDETWSANYKQEQQHYLRQCEISQIQKTIDSLNRYIAVLNSEDGEPIETLNLEVRAFNLLKRAGLDTIPMVIESIRCGRLPVLRNAGEGTIEDIRRAIEQHGYQIEADTGDEE